MIKFVIIFLSKEYSRKVYKMFEKYFPSYWLDNFIRTDEVTGAGNDNTPPAFGYGRKRDKSFGNLKKKVESH